MNAIRSFQKNNFKNAKLGGEKLRDNELYIEIIQYSHVYYTDIRTSVLPKIKTKNIKKNILDLNLNNIYIITEYIMQYLLIFPKQLIFCNCQSAITYVLFLDFEKENCQLIKFTSTCLQN